MFDCGCHDNDTSDALNMAFFVHSPSKPTTTPKNNGAFKNLFPTLLHFLQESLLTFPACNQETKLREPVKMITLSFLFILAPIHTNTSSWASHSALNELVRPCFPAHHSNARSLSFHAAPPHAVMSSLTESSVPKAMLTPEDSK